MVTKGFWHVAEDSALNCEPTEWPQAEPISRRARLRWRTRLDSVVDENKPSQRAAVQFMVLQKCPQALDRATTLEGSSEAVCSFDMAELNFLVLAPILRGRE
jgi:hypothetical protein